MTYIFYLDRYHLGDPLFLNRVARDLAALAAPRLVVHGPGDEAELALEADGSQVRWEGDVPVAETHAQHITVERVTREVGRRVTHTLNDAGLAAVQFDGASRGLLRSAQGTLTLGNVDWMRTLVEQGVVPVVGALAEADGPALSAVSGVALGGLLTRAFEPAQLVMLGRGLRTGMRGRDTVAPDAVPAEIVSEAVALRAEVALGTPVLLTGNAGIASSEVLGTRIIAG